MMDALLSSKSRLFQKVHSYASFQQCRLELLQTMCSFASNSFLTFNACRVADGYWIIVIFSFVETMVVVALLYLRKWLSRLKADTVTRANESELFITAGRSLETGVISTAIVAQWTSAATLLQRCVFQTLMAARCMASHILHLLTTSLVLKLFHARPAAAIPRGNSAYQACGRAQYKACKRAIVLTRCRAVLVCRWIFRSNLRLFCRRRQSQNSRAQRPHSAGNSKGSLGRCGAQSFFLLRHNNQHNCDRHVAAWLCLCVECPHWHEFLLRLHADSHSCRNQNVLGGAAHHVFVIIPHYICDFDCCSRSLCSCVCTRRWRRVGVTI
jgi:hypothetical protein